MSVIDVYADSVHACSRRPLATEDSHRFGESDLALAECEASFCGCLNIFVLNGIFRGPRQLCVDDVL